MKFSLSILPLLAIVTMASAAGPISEYPTLLSKCNAAGAETYVAVIYSDGVYRTFKYDECYPYRIDANTIAEQAVFCKSVTCTSNPQSNCTGGAVPPVPVPVPALTTLINVADFVELIGQGATCERNGLPI